MSNGKFQIPDIKLGAVKRRGEDGIWEIAMAAPGDLAAVRFADAQLLPLLGTHSADTQVVTDLIKANSERVEAYIRGAVIAEWPVALGVSPIWKDAAPNRE